MQISVNFPKLKNWLTFIVNVVDFQNFETPLGHMLSWQPGL